MEFVSRDQFEKQLEEQYNSLTKKDFANLMTNAGNKLRGLVATDDIKIEKDNEADEIILVSVSKPFYEIVFKTYQFAAKTRKLSFKQYKCLSAFTKFRPESASTQFKQF